MADKVTLDLSGMQPWEPDPRMPRLGIYEEGKGGELIARIDLTGKVATNNQTPPGAGAGPKPLDLDAIEARLAAATPGPWFYDEYDYINTSLIDEETGQEYHQYLAQTANDMDYSREHNVKADGEFIANAPTDIAALVKEVYRLREKVADLKDELNDCNNARWE